MKSSPATAKPRRSARSSVLASLPSEPNDSVRVTPSPTEADPESSENAKPKKRKLATPKSHSKEKKTTSPYFDKANNKCSSRDKLELASASDEAEEVDSDAPLASAAKRKRTSKSGSTTANEAAAKTKATAAKRKSKNTDDNDSLQTVQKKTPVKSVVGKKKSTTNNNNNSSSAANDDNSNIPIPAGGEPDGNGGLNQPAPYNVEYSKSSRATCRTCDEIIKKGDVRVGHTPLFRGKVR